VLGDDKEGNEGSISFLKKRNKKLLLISDLPPSHA
jgi:hypothetical protein